MSDKWKDLGETGLSDFARIIPGPNVETHRVENTETGEVREVIIHGDETVGEAIERGEFSDDE
jgi:hypothetical protein